jgi:AcrR family transcriptional regulator
VFAEHGYLRGNASEVARRVGVSEPVVFQNFGTEATLFAAVVHHAADHVCRLLDRMTTGRTPVTAVLATMLDRHHLTHVHSASSVGAIYASAVTGEPAARNSTRRFATAIAALLDRGKADGELRPDLDTEAAAWWLLSLVASQRFRHATAPTDVEVRLARNTIGSMTAADRS